MATTVLGLKTFTASDPVDYNEVNDNYTKIDAGVKTALQGRAAHNLLDNSDFSKPVAQAGMNGAHGSTVYVVDRWIANACTAEQSQGCLKITTTKAYAHIYQKVTGVAGKTLTCAGKFSGSGVGAIRIYDVNISTMYAELKNISGIGCVSFTVPNDVDTISVLLYPNQSNVSSGLIYWAALYEGSYTADTLPAYQPKGYAAELAECMRYFERIGSAESLMLGNTVYVGSGAKAFVFSIKYAPKRLKSPSVTFSSVGNYRVLFQDAVNASTYGASGITAIDDIMAENPYARFRVSISSAIDTNSWAALQRQDGAQNAYIDISADL